MEAFRRDFWLLTDVCDFYVCLGLQRFPYLLFIMWGLAVLWTSQLKLITAVPLLMLHFYPFCRLLYSIYGFYSSMQLLVAALFLQGDPYGSLMTHFLFVFLTTHFESHQSVYLLIYTQGKNVILAYKYVGFFKVLWYINSIVCVSELCDKYQSFFFRKEQRGKRSSNVRDDRVQNRKKLDQLGK